MNWNVGRHGLKFGADIISTQDYVNIRRNQNGSYTYNDFNSFALDYGPPGAESFGRASVKPLATR